MRIHILERFILSLAILLLGFTSSIAQNEEEEERNLQSASAYSRIKNFDISFLSSSMDAFDFEDVVGSENYLLLIAADKYKFWKSLNNAVRDARDVKKVLMERYGFKQENIYELLNEEVTDANIEAQFESLVGKGTNIDNLLIYYSGHGFYDASFDLGYWVPYDGKTQSGATSTFIPNDRIRDYIKQMKFRHVFLVADACFSGSLFSETRGITKEESVKSRWGLSSGNLEVVSDGKKGANSPFAGFLIQYLKENLKDKIFVEELASFVEKQVEETTEQDPLYGQLSGVGSEGGQFFFTLQGTEEEKEDSNTKK